MPSKVVVLNFIGIVLQYAVLGLLYYFLFMVLQVAYRDLRGERAAGRAREEAAPTVADRESARLVVVDAGPVAMSKPAYELAETVSIGRGEENDIVVADSFVSHEHALITRYKHGFWLTDLGSTNGTLHNNRRVGQEILLKDGDLIAVGAVTFRFAR